jgi:anaerobic ribonucleoside-triphosphate reductase
MIEKSLVLHYTDNHSVTDATGQILLTAAERTRTEIWTRVVGYHRPVSAFNLGKQSEHAERLHFRENETC